MRYFLALLLLLLLSCAPLKTLQELPEVKAWEPEIAKFEALDKTDHYPDDAIIFAGSSSIRLWSTLARDMAPYPVIQRGYGGAKLSDFAVFADRILSPHPCRALVLFIANDITGGPLDKTPEEVRKLFLSVLKTFRRSHPETPVFWIAITPTSSRWKAWPEIKKVNELIRETCVSHKKTYFVRTESSFLNDKGEPRDELFIADKLHLNAEGYNIWSGIIRGELDKAFNKK